MTKQLYTISEIADIFSKTRAWFYWCNKNNKFTYENGDPIEPVHQSEKGSGRVYDLDTIQEIALSLYRNGTLGEDGLKKVIGKILVEKEKFQES